MTKKPSVEFKLFAPRVTSVALQGSWNQWKPQPMERGDDGTWRLSTPLKDGEYQYRFEVVRQEGDEEKRILVADPVALRFAGVSTDCSSITIRGGQPIFIDYEWQHDDVPLAPNEKLVIYELNIRDYAADGDQPGTFERMIDRLDYLADLGITAIELMPVTEAEPGDNWGYSQLSLYSIGNKLGTPCNLAHFIDECHKRGIRVIHDAVFNHLYIGAPLIQIDSDYWFYAEYPDPPNLQFGVKFNYEFFDEQHGIFPAREYALGAVNRWINHFHMDGVRFDASRALHFDLLRWLNEEAHKRAPIKPFHTIAEHVPEDSAVTGPEGPLDAAWHHSLFSQLHSTVVGISLYDHEPFNTGDLLNVLDARKGGYASNYNVVNYQQSHDEERTIFEMGAKAGIFDDPAFRRAKLGAALLLTAPGLPMLWMGEEFAQASPRGGNKEPQPVDWSLLENERNRDLHQHYKRLIKLRKENPALLSDTFEVLADMPDRGIIAFKRWGSDGDIAVIAANLRPQYGGEIRIDLPGIAPGNWHEFIYDYDARVEDGTLIDTLAESEVKVFLYRK